MSSSKGFPVLAIRDNPRFDRRRPDCVQSSWVQQTTAKGGLAPPRVATGDRGELQRRCACHQAVVEAEQLALHRSVHDVQRRHWTPGGQQRVERLGVADDHVGARKHFGDRTDSDYDREKLQERLAKLAGGGAVIKAGAATEVELKERKHRIEDAVRNAKAAVEDGIVAGGGGPTRPDPECLARRVVRA
jgi:hypothetical protein